MPRTFLYGDPEDLDAITPPFHEGSRHRMAQIGYRWLRRCDRCPRRHCFDALRCVERSWKRHRRTQHRG